MSEGHHGEEEVRLHHVCVWDRVPGCSSTSGIESESGSGSENVRLVAIASENE